MGKRINPIKCLLCDVEMASMSSISVHLQHEHGLHTYIESMQSVEAVGSDGAGDIKQAPCPVCREIITEDVGDRSMRLGYRWVQHLYSRSPKTHRLALMMIGISK